MGDADGGRGCNILEHLSGLFTPVVSESEFGLGVRSRKYSHRIRPKGHVFGVISMGRIDTRQRERLRRNGIKLAKMSGKYTAQLRDHPGSEAA
jgi:hypothetical protein